MESLRKLETTVGDWYKSMPHLPKNGQRWLAENAWWIVLIGVILGALGILGTLSAMFLAGAVLVGTLGVAGAAFGGLAFLAAIVPLAFAVVTIVITALAVAPLKGLKRNGWSLLFLVAVINVVALAVAFLLTLNLFGLVWGLLATAVSLYFLYEIQGFFVSVKAQPAKK